MSKPNIPWYDDKKEIARRLKEDGLGALSIIARSRMRASASGSTMTKPWADFLISGQVILKRSGNIYVFSGKAPGDHFPIIELVLELSNYEKIAPVRHLRNRKAVPILPDEAVLCPHCQMGWNLHTCSDFKWEQQDVKRIPTTNQLGKNLVDVMAEITRPNQKSVLCPHPNHPMFNPEKHKSDGKITLNDSHLVRDGDELWLSKYTLFHRKCFRLFEIKKRTETLSNALKKALMETRVIELVNSQTTGTGLLLVWHIQTNFGALKVVERHKGHYTLDGSLCNVPIGQIVWNSKGSFTIDSNGHDLAKNLTELRNKM